MSKPTNFLCAVAVTCLALSACNGGNAKTETNKNALPLAGTWKLLSGTLIEKGDTMVTDYTKDLSFIKIINDSHFAFLQHGTGAKKDSASSFVAGGGDYSLKDSLYTEHLQYCSARNWEGHDFTFHVSIRHDTLVQQGVEKVERAGVDRINIEKYVRVKP